MAPRSVYFVFKTPQTYRESMKMRPLKTANAKRKSKPKLANHRQLPTDQVPAAPTRLATFMVKSTSSKGIVRHATIVSDAGKELPIKFHKTALVGPGDRLHFDPSNSTRVFVTATEDGADLIPVTPHFERRQRLRLGNVDYEIIVREPTTQADLEAYEYLEGFHYKTSSAIVSEENESGKSGSATGGRKGILLAFLKVGSRFVPAGYIELQMPLLMCKPRHILFAHGFRHPKRPVSWKDWDVANMRKFINLIVRIARVVTSPDLRGLGLARLLIETAKEYAKDRWHVGGRRPLFMEISAEMLNYMDFATSAGLHFIGLTEGNLARIHRDLVQMGRGQKMTFGIMTLQKKYLTQLQSLARVTGKPFPEVLERLNQITSETDSSLRASFNKLRPEEWYLFKKVLRFPIPYFMCGLDEHAENFISAHGRPAPSRLETRKKQEISARLSRSEIKITSTYEIPDSAHARAVQDCFGLDGSLFKMTLVGPVSVEASGGNIILFTGPSGSGKSLLLSALDPQFDATGLSITHKDLSTKPYQVAWMKNIPSERPLIEYFANTWGMETSISALNQAGLSEAFVYLRPYHLLSRGQQYRARLAALSLGPEPVWLMDEFCADLDPFTARVVATNLRKQIIKTGRIAFVAAANNVHYIDALRPTKVIYLRYNGKTEALTYKEYVDEFCGSSK